MEIDYFCFSVPDLTSNDYVINQEDDENTKWIKTKEKELMDTARENNLLVVFDRTTKKFYMDDEEIDLTGKIVFPRSFIPYEEELLNYLEQARAKSIQTISDLIKITNWPQKIQPVYRRVMETTYGEFQQNIETYKTNFKTIFFKTAKKSHTHCILKYFGTKPPLWNISLEDDIFISDVFKSITDEKNAMNCKEYRVFVLNNKLLSISRSYIDYPTEVPDEVKLFVEEQINRASLIADSPSSYVLDVGEVFMDDKEVIDIIEYNSICSSGLEVCNLLVEELLKLKQSSIQLIKRRN